MGLYQSIRCCGIDIGEADVIIQEMTVPFSPGFLGLKLTGRTSYLITVVKQEA